MYKDPNVVERKEDRDEGGGRREELFLVSLPYILSVNPGAQSFRVHYTKRLTVTRAQTCKTEIHSVTSGTSLV